MATTDERSGEEKMNTDTQQIPDIAATPAWQALQRHHDDIGEKHLREFFSEDPARGTELALTVGDLYIDYSKHRVTRETLQLLIDLSRTARLEQQRDQRRPILRYHRCALAARRRRELASLFPQHR